MDHQTPSGAAAVGLAEPPVAHLSADGRGSAAAGGTTDAAKEATDSRDVAGGAGHETRAAITRVGFADVWRVDAERREIELCATSEAVDSYDTVFSYEASKDAFDRWTGNVREMHDPRKAVGTKVGVRCDDAEQRIYVRVRISRGAEDTWQKVLDGTLRGASIGARNVVWQKRLWPRAGDQRPRDVAVRYDLVELSLVDNPSNPDALGVTIVRDAVPDAALLDSLDYLDGDAPVDADEARGWESLGVRASHAPADGLAPRRESDESAHGNNGQAHPSAAATSANPGSAGATLRTPAPLHGRPGKDAVRPPHNCAPAGAVTREAAPAEATRDRGPFSANEQGYPDVGVPARAEEPPTSALGMTPEGNARQRFHDALLGIAQGCGCALCAMAAALYDDSGADRGEDAAVARGEALTSLRGDVSLVRALAAGTQSSAARLDAVQAGIRDIQALVREAAERTAGANADLRRRLEALEAQPLPGGPAARPVEKSLALAPQAARGETSAARADDAVRALQALAGRLTDPQAQIAVAAELIRLQQER